MLKKKASSMLLIAVVSGVFHTEAVAANGRLILKGAAVNSSCYISDNGVVSGEELLLRLPTVPESNVKSEPDVVHVMDDRQGMKFTCSEDVDSIRVIFAIPNEGGVTGKNIHNTDSSPNGAQGVGVRLAALLSSSGEESIVPSSNNWLDFSKGNAKSLVVSPDNNNQFNIFMGANYVKLQDVISPGLVDAKVTITLQAI